MSFILFQTGPPPLAQEWEWVVPVLFTLGFSSLLSLGVLLFPMRWDRPRNNNAAPPVRFMLRIHGVQLLEGMMAERLLLEGTLGKQSFALLWSERDMVDGITVIEEEWHLEETSEYPLHLMLEFAIRCGSEGNRFELFSDFIQLRFNPVEGPAYGSAHMHVWENQTRWPQPCGIVQYSLRTTGGG